MKKKIFNIITLLFIITISSITFSDGFEQVGEYYRFNKSGYYVFNEFVNHNMNLYYLDGDGYMVTNRWFILKNGDKEDKYYASYDGVIMRSGKHSINGYDYYFDYDGKLLYGWIEDTYYANEEGYLVSGFQQLKVPETWHTEEKNENNAWFYFNTSDKKKVCATNSPYMYKIISDCRYCFDQNGILRTGWRQIKETEPVMNGYMYFIPEETSKFKYGEAVYNTWYAIEPPSEINNSGEIRYFYFNNSGNVKAAKEGTYIKNKINNKTYLFNEFGYAVYGIRRVGSDYYYFGDTVNDCSMKTGTFTLYDDAGNKMEVYFDEKNDGKGYTGIYKNKLYYKGLLQKASSSMRYIACKVNNVVYLVNQSGNVVKNKKKVKDADGVEWSSDSSGIVKKVEGDITDAEPPIETED